MKLIVAATLLCFVSTSLAVAQQQPPDQVARANEGTVGVITGMEGGTYARTGADLTILDDGTLRVLPTLGKGSLQNLSDILYLKGVDIGFVQADALTYTKQHGMFANLTVTTGEPASVLTVPRTAIVYSLYGDNVFVVRAAPHAREEGGVSDKGGVSGLIVERRFVKVGPAQGERIAIEDGLRAGERVVTAGQIKLQAYMPVAIDETAALPAPTETPRP